MLENNNTDNNKKNQNGNGQNNLRNYVVNKIANDNGQLRDVATFDFPSYLLSDNFNPNDYNNVLGFISSNKLTPNFGSNPEYYRNIAENSVLNSINNNNGFSKLEVKQINYNNYFKNGIKDEDNAFIQKQNEILQQFILNPTDVFNAQLNKTIDERSKNLQEKANNRTVEFISKIEQDEINRHNRDRVINTFIGQKPDDVSFKANYDDIKTYTKNIGSKDKYISKDGEVKYIKDHYTANFNIFKKANLLTYKLPGVGFIDESLNPEARRDPNTGEIKFLTKTQKRLNYTYDEGTALVYNPQAGIYEEKEIKDIKNYDKLYNSITGDRAHRGRFTAFTEEFVDGILDIGNISPTVANIITGSLIQNKDKKNLNKIEKYLQWKYDDTLKDLELNSINEFKASDLEETQKWYEGAKFAGALGNTMSQLLLVRGSGALTNALVKNVPKVVSSAIMTAPLSAYGASMFDKEARDAGYNPRERMALYGAIFSTTSLIEGMGGNILYKGIPDNKMQGILNKKIKNVFKEANEVFGKGTSNAKNSFVRNSFIKSFAEVLNTTTAGNIFKAGIEEGTEEWIQGLAESLIKNTADYNKYKFQEDKGFDPTYNFDPEKNGLSNILAASSPKRHGYFIDQAAMGFIGGHMFGLANSLSQKNRHFYNNINNNINSFTDVAYHMIRSGEKSKLIDMINQISKDTPVIGSKRLDINNNPIAFDDNESVSQNNFFTNSLLEQVDAIEKTIEVIGDDNLEIANGFASEGVKLQVENNNLNNELSELNSKENLTDDELSRKSEIENIIEQNNKEIEDIFTKEENTKYSKKYNDYIKNLIIGTDFALRNTEQEYANYKNIDIDDLTENDYKSSEFTNINKVFLKKYLTGKDILENGFILKHNEIIKKQKENEQIALKTIEDIRTKLSNPKDITLSEYNNAMQELVNAKSNLIESSDYATSFDERDLSILSSNVQDLLIEKENINIIEEINKLWDNNKQSPETLLEIYETEDIDEIKKIEKENLLDNFVENKLFKFSKLRETEFAKEANLENILFDSINELFDNLNNYKNNNNGSLEGFPNVNSTYSKLSSEINSIPEIRDALDIMNLTSYYKEIDYGDHFNGKELDINKNDYDEYTSYFDDVERNGKLMLDELSKLNNANESDIIVSQIIRNELQRKFAYSLISLESVKKELGDDLDIVKKELNKIGIINLDNLYKEDGNKIIFSPTIYEDNKRINKTNSDKLSIEKVNDIFTAHYDKIINEKNLEYILSTIFSGVNPKYWYDQINTINDDDLGIYNENMLKVIINHNKMNIDANPDTIKENGLVDISLIDKIDTGTGISRYKSGSSMIIRSFLSYLDSLAVSENTIHNVLEDIYSTHTDLIPISTEQEDLLKFILGAHIGDNKGFKTAISIAAKKAKINIDEQNIIDNKRGVYVKGSYGSGKTTIASPYFLLAMARLNPTLPIEKRIKDITVVTHNTKLEETFQQILDPIVEDSKYDFNIKYKNIHNYKYIADSDNDLIIWDEAGLVPVSNAFNIIKYISSTENSKGISPFSIFLGDKSQMLNRRLNKKSKSYDSKINHPLFALKYSSSQPLTKIYSNNIQILQELANNAVQGEKLPEWKYIENENKTLTGTQQFNSVKEVVNAFINRLEETKNLPYDERPVLILASEFQEEAKYLEDYKDYVYTLTPDINDLNPKFKSIQGLRKPMVYLAFDYKNIINYNIPNLIEFNKNDIRSIAYTGITRASKFCGLIGSENEYKGNIYGLDTVDVPVRSIEESINEQREYITSNAYMERFAPNSKSNIKEVEPILTRPPVKKPIEVKAKEDELISSTGNCILKGKNFKRGDNVKYNNLEYKIIDFGKLKDNYVIRLSNISNDNIIDVPFNELNNKIEIDETPLRDISNSDVRTSIISDYSKKKDGYISFTHFSTLINNNSIFNLSEETRREIRMLHTIIANSNVNCHAKYSTLNNYESFGQVNSVENTIDIVANINKDEIQKYINENNLNKLKNIELNDEIINAISTICSLARPQIAKYVPVSNNDLLNTPINEIISKMKFNDKSEQLANEKLLQLYKSGIESNNNISSNFNFDLLSYYLTSRKGDTKLKSFTQIVKNDFRNNYISLNPKAYTFNNSTIIAINPFIKLNNQKTKLLSDILIKNPLIKDTNKDDRNRIIKTLENDIKEINLYNNSSELFQNVRHTLIYQLLMQNKSTIQKDKKFEDLNSIIDFNNGIKINYSNLYDNVEYNTESQRLNLDKNGYKEILNKLTSNNLLNELYFPIYKNTNGDIDQWDMDILNVNTSGLNIPSAVIDISRIKFPEKSEIKENKNNNLTIDRNSERRNSRFDESYDNKKEAKRIALSNFNKTFETILGSDIDIISVEDRKAISNKGHEIFGKLSNGNITLYTENNNVKITTPRHEIFHWVYNHILPSQFRDNVKDETKKILKNNDASDLEIDEYLANKYAKLYSGKEQKGVKGFIAKLFNFVRQITFNLSKQGRYLNELFKNIESGEFSSTGMRFNYLNESESRFDTIENSLDQETIDKLNYKVEEDTSEKEVFNKIKLFGGINQYLNVVNNLVYDIVRYSYFYGENFTIDESLDDFLNVFRKEEKERVYDESGKIRKEYESFEKEDSRNIFKYSKEQKSKFFTYLIATDKLLKPIMNDILPNYDIDKGEYRSKSYDTIDSTKSRTRAFDEKSSSLMNLFMKSIKYYKVNDNESIDDVEWVPGQFINEKRARTLMIKATNELKNEQSSKYYLELDGKSLTIDVINKLKELANESVLASEDRNLYLSIAKSLEYLSDIKDSKLNEDISIQEKTKILEFTSLRDRLIKMYANSFQRNSINLEMSGDNIIRNVTHDNLSKQIQYNIKDNIGNKLFSGLFLNNNASKGLSKYNIINNKSGELTLTYKLNNDIIPIIKATTINNVLNYEFINAKENAEIIINSFNYLGYTQEVPSSLFRRILNSTNEDNAFVNYENKFINNPKSLYYISGLNNNSPKLQQLLANTLIGSIASLNTIETLKENINQNVSLDDAIDKVKNGKLYKFVEYSLKQTKHSDNYNLNKSLGVEGDTQFASLLDYYKIREALGDLTMYIKGSNGEVFNYDQLGKRFLKFNTDSKLTSRFNKGRISIDEDPNVITNDLNSIMNSNIFEGISSIESLKENNKATNIPENYDYIKYFSENFFETLSKGHPEIPMLNLADRLDMYTIKINEKYNNSTMVDRFKNRAESYNRQHLASLDRWKNFVSEYNITAPKQIFNPTKNIEQKREKFENWFNTQDNKFLKNVQNSDLILNLDYKITKVNGKKKIAPSNDLLFNHELFNLNTYKILSQLDNKFNNSEKRTIIESLYHNEIVKDINFITQNSNYTLPNKHFPLNWKSHEIFKDINTQTLNNKLKKFMDENNINPKQINPTYFQWFYYNTVIGGDFNDIAFGYIGNFKDSDERTKRSKTITTPIELASSYNKYTLGKSFDMISISDDLKDKVIIKGEENNNVETDDGGARMTLLGAQMLKNSFGGENSLFGKGVIKPLYNDYLVGLKFALVPMTEQTLNLSHSMKQLEVNALNVWSNNVNKEFPNIKFNAAEMFFRLYEHNNNDIESTTIDMMDEIELLFGNDFDKVKDMMVALIVPPGSIKKGKHRMNFLDITKPINKELKTIKLNTSDFGMITNLSSDPNNNKKKLVPFNQLHSIIGALSPSEQANLNNLYSQIFNKGIENYKKELESIDAGDRVGDEALTYQVKEFMKNISISNTRDDRNFELMSNPDVEINLPNISPIIKNGFRSYITSNMIKTKYDGLRTTEAESAYIDLYKINNIKYTAKDIKKYYGLEINKSGEYETKYGEKISVEIIKPEASYVKDGNIIDSDVICANINMNTFKMKPEESLNDWYLLDANTSQGNIFELLHDKDKAGQIIESVYNDDSSSINECPIIRFLEETEQTINKENVIKAIENFEASLRQINVRIPTGKAGQVTPSRIVAFVNDADNIMYMPSGNNKRSDADKDGDQLSTYIKHIDSKGNIIDDDSIEGLHNKIIDTVYKGLNENPNIYDQESDVSGIENYSELEKDDSEYVLNSFSESLNNWFKAKSGASAIGIHANAVSVVNSLVNSINLIPDSFRLFKNGNRDTQGEILNYIGDWLQVILDNIKSNTLGNFGISQYAINTLVPLILRSKSEKFDPNVVTKEIYDFFQDPVVKEVYNDLEYFKRLEVFESKTPYEIVSEKIFSIKNRKTTPDLTARLNKLRELQDILVEAEGFRRLSHFISIRNGIANNDYSYDKYIENSQLYLGQSLKDYENNLDINIDNYMNYYKNNSNAYLSAKSKMKENILLDLENKIYNKFNVSKILSSPSFSAAKEQLKSYTNKYLIDKDIDILYEDSNNFKNIKKQLFKKLSQGSFINKKQNIAVNEFINNTVISEYFNSLPDDKTKFTIIPFELTENGLDIPNNLNGNNIYDSYTINAKEFDNYQNIFAELADFIFNTLLDTNISEHDMEVYYKSILGEKEGIYYYKNTIAPILDAFNNESKFFKDNIKIVSDRNKKRIAIENIEHNDAPQLLESFKSINSPMIKDMFVYYSLITSKFKLSKYSFSQIIPDDYYEGENGLFNASKKVMDKLHNDKLINENMNDILNFIVTNPDALRYITPHKKTFNTLKSNNNLPLFAKTTKNYNDICYNTSNDNNITPITNTNIYDFNFNKPSTIEGSELIKFLSGLEIIDLLAGNTITHTFLNNINYEDGNVIIPGGHVAKLQVLGNNTIRLTKLKETKQVKLEDSKDINTVNINSIKKILPNNLGINPNDPNLVNKYWAAYANNPKIFNDIFKMHNNKHFISDENNQQIADALNSIKDTLYNQNAISNVTKALRKNINSEYCIRMLNDLFPSINIIQESNGAKAWVDKDGMHLNINKITPDTPMHEYTHIMHEWLRNNNNKEYEKLVNKAKSLINSGDILAVSILDHLNKINIQRDNPLSYNEIVEEFLATYSGIITSEDILQKMAEYNVIESTGANAKELINNSTNISKDLRDAIKDSWNKVSTLKNNKINEYDSLINTYTSLLNTLEKEQLFSTAYENMKDTQRWYAQEDSNIDVNISTTKDIKDFLFNENIDSDSQLANNIYNNLLIDDDGKHVKTYFLNKEYKYQYDGSKENIERIKNSIKEQLIPNINFFKDNYANNIKDVLNEYLEGSDIKDSIDKIFNGQYDIDEESLNRFLEVSGVTNSTEKVIKYSELKDEVNPELKKLYNEKFIGDDPLIAIHSSNGNILISIIDITNINLSTKSKYLRNNNLLGRLSTNNDYYNNGGTFTNSIGDIKQFEIGLLVNNILKNNPNVNIASISVNSLNRNKGLNTKNIVDLSLINKNFNACSLNKDFMQMINDEEIQDILLNPIEDNNFLMSRLNAYFSSTDNYERGLLDKVLNSNDLTISQKKDQIKNYLNYIKNTHKNTYSEHKGYLDASRLLIQLEAGYTSATDHVGDMNWFESKTVGSYNHKSGLIQAVKKAYDVANVKIRNKMLNYQKDINGLTRDIINWKKLKNPDIILSSSLVDLTSNFFSDMYIYTMAKDPKTGEMVRINTGELHYNIDDPRTKKLLDEGKLTKKHIELANIIMKNFKEIKIESLLYSNRYNKNYNITNARNDFNALYGNGNILPVINKSIAELLFSKKKANKIQAKKLLLQNLSNDAKLFNDIYEESTSIDDGTINNVFSAQDDAEYRNYLLGIKQVGIKYENNIAVKEYEVIDPALNSQCSTNIYNTFNYFAMSSIRKPILESDVVPILSASTAILNANKNANKNTITYLTRWANRNLNKINADNIADLKFGEKYNLHASVLVRGLLRATTFLSLGYNIGVGLKSYGFNTLQQSILSASYSAQEKFSDEVFDNIKGDEQFFTIKSFLKAQKMFGLGLDATKGISKNSQNNFKKYYKIAKHLGIVLSSDQELLESPLINVTKNHIFQAETAQIANIGSDIYSRIITMVAMMDTEGSLDAYDYNFKTGEVTYDVKKDKRFYTADGHKKTELGEDAIYKLIENNTLEQGFKSPIGHDAVLINNIKRVTDKYVIGAMSDDVKPLIGNHWAGALLSQYRLFSFEKLFNAGMFASKRTTSVGAGYKSFKDDDGNWVAEQDVIQIQGFWQTAVELLDIFKKGNELTFKKWWDEATHNQKFLLIRGIGRLCTAGLMFFAIRGFGEDDENYKYKWLWSDLIDSWMVFETFGNPIPAYNFTSNLWDIAKGDKEFKKIFRYIPGGKNITTLKEYLDNLEKFENN